MFLITFRIFKIHSIEIIYVVKTNKIFNGLLLPVKLDFKTVKIK